MSNWTTSSTADSSSYQLQVEVGEDRRPARDLFDVLVYGPDELVLVPKNGVAMGLLVEWMSATAKVAISGIGKSFNPSKSRGVDRGIITFTPKARLESWDSRFGGFGLSPDEYAACRTLIEQMRAPTPPVVTTSVTPHKKPRARRKS